MTSQDQPKWRAGILQWTLTLILLACAAQPVSARGPALSGDSGANPAGGANTGSMADAWVKSDALELDMSARASHTAVWTGTEMLIWGGRGETGQLDTGWRYNPASGAWRPITGAGAPQARENHVAVWTGSEMIVWGGRDTGGQLNTGGRYNPKSDTWEAISTTNAPTGRFYHTGVWTGTEMIVWGGQGQDGSNLSTGGRYRTRQIIPIYLPFLTDG